MPILRHTSETLVPVSACLIAKTIYDSLNFEHFIGIMI